MHWRDGHTLEVNGDEIDARTFELSATMSAGERAMNDAIPVVSIAAIAVPTAVLALAGRFVLVHARRRVSRVEEPAESALR